MLPAGSTSSLVRALEEAHARAPRNVRSTIYTLAGPPHAAGDDGASSCSTSREHIISSWRMAEQMYRMQPPPFPTLARGLFTEPVADGGDETHRIVARGYEKFFNVSELDYTTVSRSNPPPFIPVQR